MTPDDDPYAFALVCSAAAFLLGAGFATVAAWVDIARFRRLAVKWRIEALRQLHLRRRAEFAARSPVQQFREKRGEPPLIWDPSVLRPYNDHPPMRPVPVVRSADDTQVIGRIDQTGDVT